MISLTEVSILSSSLTFSKSSSSSLSRSCTSLACVDIGGLVSEGGVASGRGTSSAAGACVLSHGSCLMGGGSVDTGGILVGLWSAVLGGAATSGFCRQTKGNRKLGYMFCDRSKIQISLMLLTIYN